MVWLPSYEPVYYFYSQKTDLLNSPGFFYCDNKNIAREPCLGWHGAVEVVISLSAFQGRPWCPGVYCTKGVQVSSYPAVRILYGLTSTLWRGAGTHVEIFVSYCLVIIGPYF